MSARAPRTAVAGTKRDGSLVVECWCHSSMVSMTASAVRAGVTGSCGAAGCRPPSGPSKKS